MQKFPLNDVRQTCCLRCTRTSEATKSPGGCEWVNEKHCKLLCRTAKGKNAS